MQLLALYQKSLQACQLTLLCKINKTAFMKKRTQPIRRVPYMAIFPIMLV